jgi:transposase-like protein
MCEFNSFWSADNGKILQCSACRHKIRILPGTVFQDTHLPLTLWFQIMWDLVAMKLGTNALGLTRTTGLSYTTVWNILHKLRRAMVREGREKLNGTVEVDEALIGGVEEGVPGRGAIMKTLVVLGVEVIGDKRPGRIRMAVIPDATAITLTDFIQENVEPGSKLVTDGWSGYSGISSEGFEHTVKIMKNDKNALPRVHLVFSLLKRWLTGTYQGAVTRRYLDYYLDEYIFRFNRRTSGDRGKLFMRLLEQAVKTPPTTRADLKIPLVTISKLDREYSQFVRDIMHDVFYDK